MCIDVIIVMMYSKSVLVNLEEIVPKCIRVDIIEGTGLLEVTDGDDWTKEQQFLSLYRGKNAQHLW